MKKGFTLAEALTTMGIIGVVAAIGIPMVVSSRPNQEMTMLKKAYFTIEKVVAEIINDEDLYDTSREEGLADTGDPNPDVSDCDGGTGKFCCLFASKLNSVNVPACTNNNTNTVTTSDGIIYTLPISNFAAAQTITVDVNGARGVNSLDGDSPDRFTITVHPSGRIVAGTNAATYLTARNLRARTLTEAAE